jgi:hypothetical protein
VPESRESFPAGKTCGISYVTGAVIAADGGRTAI